MISRCSCWVVSVKTLNEPPLVQLGEDYVGLFWLALWISKYFPNPAQGAMTPRSPSRRYSCWSWRRFALFVRRRNYRLHWASFGVARTSERGRSAMMCTSRNVELLTAFNVRCKDIATGPAQVNDRLMCCVYIKKRLVVSSPPFCVIATPNSGCLLAVTRQQCSRGIKSQTWIYPYSKPLALLFRKPKIRLFRKVVFSFNNLSHELNINIKGVLVGISHDKALPWLLVHTGTITFWRQQESMGASENTYLALEKK